MSKIMIVEDDNNLRAIYGDRLIAEGHKVVSASDGEEALAMAVKEKPDLIISDVMMPKISGFDMLDILRSTPETRDTKVIMMTALSQTEDKQRADKLGADKYLVKSQVTLDDVARVVNEVLASTGVAAAAAAMPSAPAAPATATAPVADTPAPAAMQQPAPEATVPAAPLPEPSVQSMPPAEPVSTPAVPPVAEPVSAPAPDPDPAAPAEPAVTIPVDAQAVAAAADEAAKDAEPEAEEKADITAQIESFISTNVPDVTPAAEVPTGVTAQDHALNAATNAPAVPEPAPEEPRGGEKVIQPLPTDDSKPNIYDLYEKEMQKEATSAEPAPAVVAPEQAPAAPAEPAAPATPTPEPVAQPSPVPAESAAPAVQPAPEPQAPASPAPTTEHMPVQQPPDDNGGVPHPNDPSSIAL